MSKPVPQVKFEISFGNLGDDMIGYMYADGYWDPILQPLLLDKIRDLL